MTIVEAASGRAGGWRAACIHISRDNTGESILCKFGVDTPLRTREGPISTALAQRIAADRINEATQRVFGAATLESPLGMLCESLKVTLRTSFEASLAGARFRTRCDAKTTPVEFGDFIL
ncbi:hypothetical protein [Corallococcus sp. CA054B]|uniref:hypothetical protein n=1 Tax=Corallococcus sp. CA054B TaxID=2316734 RepID=UPI001F27BECC|nr:hypothetical protein [Corallococcus sp. CA054B]